MKKLISVLALAGSFTFAISVHAQGADPKLDVATKVVALQQGPELDRLIEQLTASTTQELLQEWGPKLETLPKAKQPQDRDQLNEELKKYTADVSGLINSKVKSVSNDALVPAYMEKFTLDELKQIAAFFEAPAIKKYQAAAPELGTVFVQKLIESTRTDVQARAKQFDDTAAKVVGATPAPKAAAEPAKGKPPAKK